MAKQLMKWAIEGAELICTHVDNNNSTTIFNMTGLFGDKWNTFDNVERAAAVYGVKQKLADACARPNYARLNADEREEVMTTLWDRITVDRKWVSKRESQEMVPIKKAVANAKVAGLDAETTAKILGKPLETINTYWN